MTTSESPTRPTFIVIGAMKGGTTSLAAYLDAHPDVFVTRPKEPHFFSGLGPSNDVEWYERLFEPGRRAHARGEASASYTMAPHAPNVPERIAALLPDVRLIYLIRNPVERIRSHHVMRVAAGVEHGSLEDALDSAPRLLDQSRYGFQLDRYLEHFSRDQILVVSSERLHGQRRDTLAEVFGFLGVDAGVDVPGTQLEHFRSVDRREFPKALDIPRAIARRTRVLRRLSRPMMLRMRRRLSRPLDVEVTPDAEKEIWSRLGSDLVRLREIVGPDFDLWGRA